MSAGTLTSADFLVAHPEFKTAPAAMVSAAVTAGNDQVDATPWGSQSKANVGAGWVACVFLATSDFGRHMKMDPAVYQRVVDMLKRACACGPITT
mgnify:CR=1 FL=1